MWVKRCIVGNIRKFELDNERMKETNALDMMQNSSIIYHTESILEMQLCVLVSMIWLTELWNDEMGFANLPEKSTSMLFIYILIAEHTLSMMFGWFRDYDIKHNGEKDRYGIENAPREKQLQFLEVVMDVGISAWIIFTMVRYDSATFNSLPFLNFWIMIDMIIMLVTLPYTYLSKFMMINGEITKNIFTLYQVQKKKLKARRENVEKSQETWKSYFMD